LYAIWSQDVCLLVGVVFFLVPNVVQFSRLVADGQLNLASALSALFLQEGESNNNAYASSWSLWVFLLCLILSRIGLWTFDLAERQLMQARRRRPHTSPLKPKMLICACVRACAVLIGVCAGGVAGRH
jgi:hypothetical protein